MFRLFLCTVVCLNRHNQNYTQSHNKNTRTASNSESNVNAAGNGQVFPEFPVGHSHAACTSGVSISKKVSWPISKTQHEELMVGPGALEHNRKSSHSFSSDTAQACQKQEPDQRRMRQGEAFFNARFLDVEGTDTPGQRVAAQLSSAAALLASDVFVWQSCQTVSASDIEEFGLLLAVFGRLTGVGSRTFSPAAAPHLESSGTTVDMTMKHMGVDLAHHTPNEILKSVGRKFVWLVRDCTLSGTEGHVKEVLQSRLSSENWELLNTIFDSISVYCLPPPAHSFKPGSPQQAETSVPLSNCSDAYIEAVEVFLRSLQNTWSGSSRRQWRFQNRWGGREIFDAWAAFQGAVIEKQSLMNGLSELPSFGQLASTVLSNRAVSTSVQVYRDHFHGLLTELRSFYNQAMQLSDEDKSGSTSPPFAPLNKWTESSMPTCMPVKWAQVVDTHREAYSAAQQTLRDNFEQVFHGSIDTQTLTPVHVASRKSVFLAPHRYCWDTLIAPPRHNAGSSGSGSFVSASPRGAPFLSSKSPVASQGAKDNVAGVPNKGFESDKLRERGLLLELDRMICCRKDDITYALSDFEHPQANGYSVENPTGNASVVFSSSCVGGILNEVAQAFARSAQAYTGALKLHMLQRARQAIENFRLAHAKPSQIPCSCVLEDKPSMLTCLDTPGHTHRRNLSMPHACTGLGLATGTSFAVQRDQSGSHGRIRCSCLSCTQQELFHGIVFPLSSALEEDLKHKKIPQTAAVKKLIGDYKFQLQAQFAAECAWLCRTDSEQRIQMLFARARQQASIAMDRQLARNKLWQFQQTTRQSADATKTQHQLLQVHRLMDCHASELLRARVTQSECKDALAACTQHLQSMQTQLNDCNSFMVLLQKACQNFAASQRSQSITDAKVAGQVAAELWSAYRELKATFTNDTALQKTSQLAALGQMSQIHRAVTVNNTRIRKLIGLQVEQIRISMCARSATTSILQHCIIDHAFFKQRAQAHLAAVNEQLAGSQAALARMERAAVDNRQAVQQMQSDARKAHIGLSESMQANRSSMKRAIQMLSERIDDVWYVLQDTVGVIDHEGPEHSQSGTSLD
jgi:hypothetical protein